MNKPELEQEQPPVAVVIGADEGIGAAILEETPEGFMQAWQQGCFAGFLCAQAVAKPMIARSKGTIIFTGASASLC